MLEPIKRVLVPLDGSRRAEGAIRYAKRIASATDGTVILLQVVEIPTQQADAQGCVGEVVGEPAVPCHRQHKDGAPHDPDKGIQRRHGFCRRVC